MASRIRAVATGRVRKLTAKQAIRAVVQQAQRLDMEVVQEQLSEQCEKSRDLADVGLDDAEPPEIEDLADSDPSPDPFETTGVDSAPPRRLPVLFAIDGENRVQARVRRPNSHRFRLQALIAGAVAEHLRRLEIRLTMEGDWIEVPAIGSNPALARLVEEISGPPGEFKKQFLKRSKSIKDFGLRLASGDIVAVSSLILPAGKKPHEKKATRAAAIAVFERRPATLAGETWSEKDWKRFERSQKRRSRQALQSEKKTPARDASPRKRRVKAVCSDTSIPNRPRRRQVIEG